MVPSFHPAPTSTCNLTSSYCNTVVLLSSLFATGIFLRISMSFLHPCNKSSNVTCKEYDNCEGVDCGVVTAFETTVFVTAALIGDCDAAAAVSDTITILIVNVRAFICVGGNNTNNDVNNNNNQRIIKLECESENKCKKMSESDLC